MTGLTLCVYRQDRIQKDTYIPPHAALELGIVYVEMDKLEEGKEWLEKSRSEYRGFLVEALVHLRTHAAFREVSDRQKALSASVVDVTTSTSNHSTTTSTTTTQTTQTVVGGNEGTAESEALKRSSSSGFGSWIRSFV